MVEALHLRAVKPAFGLDAAGRVLLDMTAPWIQDLGLLVESVEAARPMGSAPDWVPGAVLRLPFSNSLCRDGGVVCAQALLALSDTAMMLACAAAWDAYRPMANIDHTMHFLRPVNFDVIADARVMRVGRTTTFARVTLSGAADMRPVGMVSGAYATL